MKPLELKGNVIDPRGESCKEEASAIGEFSHEGKSRSRALFSSFPLVPGPESPLFFLPLFLIWFRQSNPLRVGSPSTVVLLFGGKARQIFLKGLLHFLRSMFNVLPCSSGLFSSYSTFPSFITVYNKLLPFRPMFSRGERCFFPLFPVTGPTQQGTEENERFSPLEFLSCP